MEVEGAGRERRRNIEMRNGRFLSGSISQELSWGDGGDLRYQLGLTLKGPRWRLALPTAFTIPLRQPSAVSGILHCGWVPVSSLQPKVRCSFFGQKQKEELESKTWQGSYFHIT